MVVGRQHPSVYTFFNELGKEQTDTECMLRQLKIEERIYNIVTKYDEFVNNNDIIAYLTAIGYNLKF